MKKIVLLTFVLLSFVGVLFLINSDTKIEDEKLRVSVSTFALYDIVKHIASDKVSVEMVIPFGVEVHSFEPTPKTIIGIQKSALFLYSGANLEPWIKKLPKSKNMRDMSQFVELREVEDKDDDEDHHDHDVHEHHHGLYDPHYWLDIENMKLLTQKIVLELVKLDPKNESFYLSNAVNYMDELSLLSSQFEQKLKTCEVREVVMHHNTLGYLASRYNFNVSSLSGLSPDALSNPKVMTNLSKMIKEKGIKVLFFEAFVSNRMMQSLAEENGVSLAYIEPLANITATQAKENMSYVDGMHYNLEQLSTAMRCQ